MRKQFESRCTSWPRTMVATGIIAATLLCSALADARAAEPPRLVMFTTEPVKSQMRREDGTKVQPDYWTREFVRQAILLAAREECGLLTRDEALGEPVQRDSDDCIQVRVVTWEKEGVEITLSREGKDFYSKSIELDLSLPPAYVRLVELMEELSRTEFAEALQAIGYPRQSSPQDAEAAVPLDVKDLLWQMNHVSQYAALRRLHRLNAESAGSLPVLGGLSRGYAHLTQLTLPVLDLRHKAFGARAVLYAQRMIGLEPESPLGYWHRANAWTWIGFPNGAEQDVEKAAELAPDDETPAWVQLINHYRVFQFDDLQQAALDTDLPEQQIAAVLWFLSSRMVNSEAFIIQTGKAALEVAPECLRIVSGMSDVAGVAFNHQLTYMGPTLHATAIQQHLAEVDDLPGEIIDRYGKEADEPSLAGPAVAIRESAREDRSEPSWYILAGNIQAWNTEVLIRRAHFLRHSLSMDAEDFVEPMLPALEGDPYLQVFQALGVPRVHAADAFAESLGKLDPPEMNFVSVGYNAVNHLPYDTPLADGTLREWLAEIWYYGSLLEDDCGKKIRFLDGEPRLDPAKWLAQASKRAPRHFAERIYLDWHKLGDKREWFGSEYAHYPDVQWALAKGYKATKEFEKSIAAYERYLQIVPDAIGYIDLAEGLLSKWGRHRLAGNDRKGV